MVAMRTREKCDSRQAGESRCPEATPGQKDQEGRASAEEQGEWHKTQSAAKCHTIITPNKVT